ncbi:MAG: threonine/serine exporter family protein [Clostridium sp.]|uniref:threonine/serine ThrE exporter family protein n=1 Tax=Clostridium sp. DSM 8431 TaxID=1761781 RepID=UPI0008E86F53|nr:threonine/serine exporter family protein [Clostridium sp. DSM 8431]MCR4943393.1 threonine/serine exporter family protein [Clostridium sp.]SFU40152.1 Uncharacterized membrane protein YjjP, DUF1212 family [Clostridium sp. DSM 8431]
MNLKEISDIALSVGEILLSNGSENHRIETSINKICEAYGIKNELIISSDGILLLVEDSNLNKYTSIRKVKDKCVDLYKIELVNSFSRKIYENPMSYEEAKKSLTKINKAPTFTFNVRTFASCMTGFIYTLFFNGSIIDGLASVVVCLITYILFQKMIKLGFFQFLDYYLSGIIIGFLSLLSNFILPEINQNNVITGSIMILLPGVVLTNSIKDMLYGDYSSGAAKFFEAGLIIAAVGCGVITSLFIGMKGI